MSIFKKDGLSSTGRDSIHLLVTTAAVLVLASLIGLEPTQLVRAVADWAGLPLPSRLDTTAAWLVDEARSNLVWTCAVCSGLLVGIGGYGRDGFFDGGRNLRLAWVLALVPAEAGGTWHIAGWFGGYVAPLLLAVVGSKLEHRRRRNSLAPGEDNAWFFSTSLLMPDLVDTMGAFLRAAFYWGPRAVAVSMFSSFSNRRLQQEMANRASPDAIAEQSRRASTLSSRTDAQEVKASQEAQRRLGDERLGRKFLYRQGGVGSGSIAEVVELTGDTMVVVMHHAEDGNQSVQHAWADLVESDERQLRRNRRFAEDEETVGLTWTAIDA